MIMRRVEEKKFIKVVEGNSAMRRTMLEFQGRASESDANFDAHTVGSAGVTQVN